jgi:hypothetical protein
MMATRPRNSAKKKETARSAAPEERVVQQAPPDVPIAQDQSYSFRPLLQTDDRTQQAYVNYLEANSTLFELVLTLGKMPARFNLPDLEHIRHNENVIVNSVTQITMPIGFAPYFVKVIADALNAHAAQWGGVAAINPAEEKPKNG